MPLEEFEMLLQFFKVLADEKRLKLLGILGTREYSVEELAALLQVKAPTISHHLAQLKRLNLVQMRSDRNTHFYRLETENLRALSRGQPSAERTTELAHGVTGTFSSD